jgi:hypothetical protein
MTALTDADIARWRLRSQHLIRPYAAGAAHVVAHLLAVQAENPGQSAWAVACRTEHADPADLAGALESGAVLRTHALRPTWHYVCAEDVVWLVEVTAPRVQRVTEEQLTGLHGLDRRAVERASAAVLDSLSAGASLTRSQLAAALASRGVETDGHLLMILLAHLELQTLICSGPPASGEHTYALLSSRVPEPRRLQRGEALAELARRYFSAHGPATEKDLAYWATLAVSDVRAGLAEVKGDLASFEHDGRIFWHAPGDPPSPGQDPRGHLLQILDELYRGYQDSRWVLDSAGVVPRGREAAIGMALVDGQLVAGMKRTLTRVRVHFALTPFRDLWPDEVEALQQAARRYARFLGLEARLSGVSGEPAP